MLITHVIRPGECEATIQLKELSGLLIASMSAAGTITINGTSGEALMPTLYFGHADTHSPALVFDPVHTSATAHIYLPSPTITPVLVELEVESP